MKTARQAVSAAHGISLIFVRDIVGTLVSIIGFMMISRLISRVEMGVLTIATLIVALCQVLASMGMPGAATKFVSEYVALRQTKKAASVAFFVFRISLLISCALGSLVFFLSRPLSLFLLGAEKFSDVLSLLPLAIVSGGVLPSLNGTMLGLKRIKQMTVSTLVGAIVGQASAVLLLLHDWHLSGVVLAWGLGSLANGLLCLICMVQSLGVRQDKLDLRELFGFSLPLLANGLLSFGYDWLDRALLLSLTSLSDLATYSVVLKAFAVLYGVQTAISSTLFPYYASIMRLDGHLGLRRAVFKSSRYVFLLSIPAALGLAVTARPAISLIAGNVYSSGAFPLALMCLFLAIGSVGGALSEILQVLKKTLISTYVAVVMIMSGLFCLLLLVPRYGLAGASVARGLSMIVGVAVCLGFARKEVGLYFDTWAFLKSWLSAIVMVAVVVIVQTFWYDKFYLPMYVLIGGTVYLFGLRILRAVKLEDIDLLEAFLGGRFETLFGIARKTLLPGHARALTRDGHDVVV